MKRLRFIAALAVFGLLAAACSGTEVGPTPTSVVMTTTTAATAETTPTPTITGSRTRITQLIDGDCFNFDDDYEFEYVYLVGCDTLHQAEVYATISLLSDEMYPGYELLQNWASVACGALFELSVGIPVQDSEFSSDTIVPTEYEWSLGMRDIPCLLYQWENGDFAYHTGTAKDSKR